MGGARGHWRSFSRDGCELERAAFLGADDGDRMTVHDPQQQTDTTPFHISDPATASDMVVVLVSEVV